MILKLILIALGFVLLNHIRKEGFGPKMPINAWVSMRRELLKRSIKGKNIPVLCEGHAAELTRGDMALVDHKRCQKCFPAQPWPPKMPPLPPPPPKQSA